MIRESCPERPPFAPRSTKAVRVEVLDRDTTYSYIFTEVDDDFGIDLDRTLRISAGDIVDSWLDESIESRFSFATCNICEGDDALLSSYCTSIP